ncbi:MAG: hypothetical protein ACMG6S_04840 [Byssovorax sp.]
MNEMSNGPHPRRALHVRTGLAAALFGGFAVTMAACPGPTPRTDTDGSGGEGSSTSSSSASSTSGGMPCTTPSECLAPPNDCTTAICEGNTCGFAPVAAKTPCTTDGGKLCDGAGHCVACITAAQCESISSPNPCNELGVHTAPPACNSGVCEPGKVEDCGATGLICEPAGCVPCATNTDCGLPVGDCLHKQCKAGLCEKVSLPQASGCLPPAIGTCDATGTCVSRKYVFVTSATFTANLGGTAMADATCHQIAEGAGLGGKWKSWTSDGVGSPPLVRFAPSSGPYMLLDDKTVVASSWAALISGSLMHGIHLDENKQEVVSPPEVWTGTTPNGAYAGSACADWKFVDGGNLMGYVGIAGDATFGWTKMKQYTCSFKAHLYCFQQ